MYQPRHFDVSDTATLHTAMRAHPLATLITLQGGAANLPLADQNEEGANLLALNTRAQLATSALSFASQGDQQVLQFLR